MNLRSRVLFSWSWIIANSSVSTVATSVPTCSMTLCTQLTVEWTVTVHVCVCVCVEAPCPLVTSFSLWLSTALPLPDKIHNFYLMVQSGWAFWRTLPEIDVSHFRSTEDANYPLETLWGCWCNTRFPSSLCCFCICSPTDPLLSLHCTPFCSYCILASGFPLYFILILCCHSHCCACFCVYVFSAPTKSFSAALPYLLTWPVNFLIRLAACHYFQL